jgi:hypothetical protein
LASTGEVGNATAYLKVILKTSEGSAEGIFDNAVVACESLTLKGQAFMVILVDFTLNLHLIVMVMLV